MGTRLSKAQKRNRDNHYKIFARYRCLNPGKEKEFVALPRSLINHISFTSMHQSSKLLYIYMTDYARGRQEFTYPRRIFINLMSIETFRKAKNELIEHGFITVISEGGLYNNEAKYRFVSEWKKYMPVRKKKRQNNFLKNKVNV